MVVGDRVKVVGDNPWWSHEGIIESIDDSFALVRFNIWGVERLSKIWINDLRVID